MAVFNEQIQNREEILAAYDEVLAVFADTSDLDRQEKKAILERNDCHAKLTACVRENAVRAVDQAEYRGRYEVLAQRFEAAKGKLARIEEQRQERRNRQHKIEAFVAVLRAREGLLAEFDEGLFNAVVESIMVGRDGALGFLFRDGSTALYEIRG